ncbi:TPA: hypothetical protein DEP21_05715 [Patescibacteria group bacterium]|nr:hypothetical protein [Candidatus Gracilibacteria bacterium]
MKQWIEAINEIMAVCGSLSASDAQNFLKYQDLEKSLINQSDADKEEKDKLLAIVEKEKIFYQQIIND